MEEIFDGLNEAMRKWNKGEITKAEFQAVIKKGQRLLKKHDALLKQLERKIKDKKEGEPSTFNRPMAGRTRVRRKEANHGIWKTISHL